MTIKQAMIFTGQLLLVGLFFAAAFMAMAFTEDINTAIIAAR